jgi:hypothetical protein
VPDDNQRKMRKPQETTMKVQTNLRAGSQNQKRGTSTDSSSSTEVVVVYVPPVSRCVGI